MVYKEMLVELITTQYETLKELLSDFPSEDALEKVIEGLEECISLDISIDSTDPDATADVGAKFEDRSRNSVVRELDNQISSARSKLESFQSEAIRSLLNAMNEDIQRAQSPHWSWEKEDEDEDSSMWSANEWLQHFKTLDASEQFWGRMVVAFSPTHPYVDSVFGPHISLARYPLIKALKASLHSKAWEWVTPVLDKLKNDNTSDYQKTVDFEFRDVWADCAARYARTGEDTYKAKCAQLENHGVTPASEYVDLTGVFVSNETHVVQALNRLVELSGMHKTLTSPSDAPERVHGFKYMASSGTVSSAAISIALTANYSPDVASAFSKFVLEQQIGATNTNLRARKM